MYTRKHKGIHNRTETHKNFFKASQSKTYIHRLIMIKSQEYRLVITYISRPGLSSDRLFQSREGGTEEVPSPAFYFQQQGIANVP